MSLRVRYSCNTCGLVRAECEVPERGEVEGVVHWVERTVGEAVQADHQRRSPGCQAPSAQDVMIPITGARLGDADTEEAEQ